MKNMDLFAVIKSIYPSFTRTEKNIADFILANAKNVVYMTISEIATACNVSETSVFRFCRRLGKSGYQSFKVDLARAVSDSQNTPEFNSCIISIHDSFDTLIQKTLNNCTSILNETYRLADPAALSTATQWLVTSEHICFFGVGPCAASAYGSQNHFLSICPKAEYLPDYRMQLARASMLTPKDVAIMFCHTGKTREILSIGMAAKKAGAKTICVSRFSRSPLTDLSDLVLLCSGNEGPYQNGIFSMRTSVLFLLEVLFAAYCQASPVESSANRARIDPILSENSL